MKAVIDFSAIAHALHPGLWGVILLVGLASSFFLWLTNAGIDNPQGSMAPAIMALCAAIFSMVMLCLQ